MSNKYKQENDIELSLEEQQDIREDYVEYLKSKAKGIKSLRTKDANFILDFKFWALIPNVNLNFNSGFTLEFEFLCFAIYVKF